MQKSLFHRILHAFVVLALLLAVPSYGASHDPELARAIAAKERHVNALLQIPGVVGAGVGRKANGTPVIRMFTTHSTVHGLPSELDGIPAEVKVTGMIVARFLTLTDPESSSPDAVAPQAVDTTARFPRPVPLGVSTGHPAITAGTIGARVRDASGNVYALSNNHVYANINDALAGDPVIQPGAFDGGTAPGDTIGSLHDFEPIRFDGSTNIMDAAIALSSEDELNSATPADGYGIPHAIPTDAFVGQAVQKYGRTTTQTHGTVMEIEVTVDVCYEVILNIFCTKLARFVNQITIGDGSFSAGGDSGSLIVSDDGNNHPVALLFAGSDTRTIANPIDAVLARFGVTIDGSSSDLPPSLTIESPIDGALFNSGTLITFAGSASDAEDGDLTAVLSWISDLDGPIGNGGSFSAVLSDGDHTITASVIDAGGHTTSDTITVTVGSQLPPQPETVRVSSITYSTKGGKDEKKHLSFSLLLLDNQDRPVSGASVEVLLINTTTGQVWTGTGSSNANGTLTFNLSNAPSGSYTTTVMAVDATGLTWDGVTPPNGFTK